MSKASGIIDWFKSSSLVADVQQFDVDQLGAEGEAGLYKQAQTQKTAFSDGTMMIKENYYMLFKKAAQIMSQRITNEEFLESVENWLMEKELEGFYPSIGYPVHEVSSENAFYMIERDSKDAIYQLTLSVTYLWSPSSN